MSKPIEVIKQSITTLENSLKTLRSQLDDVENQPDGPAQHRAFIAKGAEIFTAQEQLDELKNLLNNLQGGK